MIVLYKESEFLCLNKIEDWQSGFYKNIKVENGISIPKAKKYAIQNAIDTSSSKFPRIIDYSPQEFGIIYCFDENNGLWEYDYVSDNLRKLVIYKEKGQVVAFEVNKGSIYCIIKSEKFYYAKMFMFDNFQILKEFKIENSENIISFSLDYAGNCFFVFKDGSVKWIDIENSIIKKMSSKDINISYDETDIIKMSSFDNKLLAFGNQTKKDISIIDLTNFGTHKVIIKRISAENIVNLRFNSKGELFISFLNNEEGSIVFTSDFLKFEAINNFKNEASEIKFDSAQNIYIRNSGNYQYILKKKSRTNTENDLKNYSGIFYSSLFDCGISEMEWDKIRVNSEIPKDTQIKISYFSFDQVKILYKEKVCELQDFIMRKDISFEEKELHLKVFFKNSIVNPNEALLHKSKGRYLILRIELNGRDIYSPTINSIHVYYNRDSYLKYLPEIYQSTGEENDFLERYLSLFEHFFMNIEEKIDNISNYFDIDKAPTVFLRWLCEWVGMEDYRNWETHKIRKLLKNSGFLNRKKGTKKALEMIIEIYVGVKPIIVENFQFNKNRNKNEVENLTEKLFGDNPYKYTVLINRHEELKEEEINSIKRILINESPAYCDFSIISLKPWIFLDKQSYLGINSTVSGYSLLKLDGKAVIPFNTVLMGSTRENNKDINIKIGLNTSLK